MSTMQDGELEVLVVVMSERMIDVCLTHQMMPPMIVPESAHHVREFAGAQREWLDTQQGDRGRGHERRAPLFQHLVNGGLEHKRKGLVCLAFNIRAARGGWASRRTDWDMKGLAWPSIAVQCGEFAADRDTKGGGLLGLRTAVRQMCFAADCDTKGRKGVCLAFDTHTHTQREGACSAFTKVRRGD